MEVISDEITTVTQNTIPINVNFDSLLEKYQDQEDFRLFYKHNFSISLEDGTNFPAYIIIFHNNAGWGEPNQIGFTVVMEKEEMKNVNMKVRDNFFTLILKYPQLLEKEFCLRRGLNS